MNMEIWKEMDEFDSKYSISNLGRVKRNERITIKKNGFNYLFSEKILKPSTNGNGYLMIKVRMQDEIKRQYIHRMVYKYFASKLISGCQINHIDFDKSNNNISNLEQIDTRRNSHHSHFNKSKTSNYPCVYFESKKYVGRFYVNSKPIYCGRHDNEHIAAQAVKEKMNQYNIEYLYA
jgi:hypothetical protein